MTGLELRQLTALPFSKIKMILKNDDLHAFSDISVQQMQTVVDYIERDKVVQSRSAKRAKKKRGRTSKPNPLNPNQYGYKKIRIISTAIGSKR